MVCPLRNLHFPTRPTGLTVMVCVAKVGYNILLFVELLFIILLLLLLLR